MTGWPGWAVYAQDRVADLLDLLDRIAVALERIAAQGDEALKPPAPTRPPGRRPPPSPPRPARPTREDGGQ